MTRILRTPDQKILYHFSSVLASEYVVLAERREKFLSIAELAYFEGLPVLRRRISYLLGRFAAKSALTGLIGEDDYRSISIEPGIFGQPIVYHPYTSRAYASRDDVTSRYDVSISHNAYQAVAIAFDARHSLGIDIEVFNPNLYETLFNAVPEEEERFLDCCKTPSPQRLLVLWTVKEALSKALRCGMATPTSVLSISSLEQVAPHQYQSTFCNFGQYKAISWVFANTAISIVLPICTTIEFNPFQEFFKHLEVGKV